MRAGDLPQLHDRDAEEALELATFTPSWLAALAANWNEKLVIATLNQ